MRIIFKKINFQYVFVFLLICCNNLQDKKNMKTKGDNFTAYNIFSNKKILIKENKTLINFKNYFKSKYDQIINIPNNLWSYIPRVKQNYKRNTSLNYMTKIFFIGSILLEMMYINKVKALEGFITEFNTSVFDRISFYDLSVLHNDLNNTDLISGNFDNINDVFDVDNRFFLTEFERDTQTNKWTKYYNFSDGRKNIAISRVIRTLDSNYTFFGVNNGNNKEILLGKVDLEGEPLILKGIELLDSGINLWSFEIHIIENKDGDLTILLLIRSSPAFFIRLRSNFDLICKQRIIELSFTLPSTSNQQMIESNGSYIIVGEIEGLKDSTIIYVNKNCGKIDSLKKELPSIDSIIYTSIIEKGNGIFFISGFRDCNLIN